MVQWIYSRGPNVLPLRRAKLDVVPIKGSGAIVYPPLFSVKHRFCGQNVDNFEVNKKGSPRTQIALLGTTLCQPGCKLPPDGEPLSYDAE